MTTVSPIPTPAPITFLPLRNLEQELMETLLLSDNSLKPRDRYLKVTELLKEGANPNILNGNGYSPLHIAVSRNQPEIAKKLLEYHAEVNIKDEELKTPLHFAAEDGNFVLIQLLLLNGADPKAIDKRGSSPLHMIILVGKRDSLELLIRHYSVEEINLQNRRGATALHLAVISGRLDFVEQLLSHGADRTIKNRYGQTPVDIAASLGKSSISTFFKDHP